ncbi:hypothetical protein BpHYR1_047537 [Brachionus plicatilis]|uniref:Uncharacterized protein n=1 Tax=Brachionus plicatilis TaxID=10195 RepID=A0A3M7QED5_BRAPC|nr:hypothetical protein BpHYR1_047537 [Brachionus plicatilis]
MSLSKLLPPFLGENLEQDHAEEFDTPGNSASGDYLSLSDSSVGDEYDLKSAKTSKVQRPSGVCKEKFLFDFLFDLVILEISSSINAVGNLGLQVVAHIAYFYKFYK